MQIKLSLCLFAAIACSFFSNAQQRKHINFDEVWKFHLGHARDPVKDFNYSIVTIFSKSGAAPGTAIDPKFKDTGWRTVDLPHDWAVELPFVNSTSFDVM